MAIRCCYTNIVVPPRCRATKTRTAASGLHHSQVSTNKASFCVGRSCSITKAFEDEVEIVCYRDEKGEMVCEGYDEGPRYQVQPEERQENQRRQIEIQIQQLLRLQSFRDPELDCAIHMDSASVPGYMESTTM